MTDSILVTCLLDRAWDPKTFEYKGTEYSGTLIEITTESSEEDSNMLIPVGIVILEDNTFHSVPTEFIRKRNI